MPGTRKPPRAPYGTRTHTNEVVVRVIHGKSRSRILVTCTGPAHDEPVTEDVCLFSWNDGKAGSCRACGPVLAHQLSDGLWLPGVFKLTVPRVYGVLFPALNLLKVGWTESTSYADRFRHIAGVVKTRLHLPAHPDYLVVWVQAGDMFLESRIQGWFHAAGLTDSRFPGSTWQGEWFHWSRSGEEAQTLLTQVYGEEVNKMRSSRVLSGLRLRLIKDDRAANSGYNGYDVIDAQSDEWYGQLTLTPAGLYRCDRSRGENNFHNTVSLDTALDFLYARKLGLDHWFPTEE